MSSNILHPCSVLRPDDIQSSYAAAIRENPDNAGIALSNTDVGLHPDTETPRLVTDHSRYWANGRTLKIKFLTPAYDFFYRAIFDAACLWLRHVNLKFVLAPFEDCEIRIALDWKTSASAIGTDALLAYADQNLPTMGFNINKLIDMRKIRLPSVWRFKFDTSEVFLHDFRRIVLHEFGHALGAEHEHQHPDAKIPWDEEKVINRLKSEGVSEQTVRWNLLRKLEAADYAYFPYDPDSVMHYNVPKDLTINDFEINNSGKTLSAKDIEFMRSIYPEQNISRHS